LGYTISSDRINEAFPDHEFLAELKLIAMPVQEPVMNEETPAAQLHAILGTEQQPYPVGKEDYLDYLAEKYL
jgi:hypothetical protein